MPKLTEKTILLENLIPDPNNPRLISGDEKSISLTDAAKGNCVKRTYDKMKKDEFKILELVDSIKENGWIPVDNIFVQAIPDQENYLVLEGNRRLTALQAIFDDEEIDESKKIISVDVFVVEMDAGESQEQYDDYISTLLGMRHHGSLITWSAFAQAKNIYTHYCQEGEYTWESFEWNAATAQKIADSLSIGVGGPKGRKNSVSVYSRLLVYRAMNQTNDYVITTAEIKKDVGVKDRHYSLFSDLLVRGVSALKGYIKQDCRSFLLDEIALTRLVKLCHFDKVERDGAPIKNPQEWSPLGKIIADPKKAELLPRVMDGKEFPSEIWSTELAKRKKWQWDNWLRDVSEILDIPGVSTDYSDPQILNALKKLDDVVNQLN